MTTFRLNRCARRVVRGLERLALSLLLLGPIAACNALDNTLSVDAPGRLPASDLDDPKRANLLVTGAVGDFECALGSFIVVGGLLSGEL